MNGSKHCYFLEFEMLLVGIGASSSEFLILCFTMSGFLNESQSQRPECSSIPQRSNCNSPVLAGEPSNEEYAPSSIAKSLLAETDAKQIVSKMCLFNS